MYMYTILFAYGFVLIIIALTIIGLWKCFTKAGEKGWKALIPFYNSVILYRISGIKGYWVIVNIISTLVGISKSLIEALTEKELLSRMSELSYFETIGFSRMTTSQIYQKLGMESFFQIILIISIISLIVTLGELALTIVCDVKFCKAFNRGGGYIAGMILVPTIFLLIIGFDNIEYIGNRKDNKNNINSRTIST